MSTRDSPLGDAERAALEANLNARLAELRAEIAGQLKNQDDPRLVGLRNRMEDTDDWAVADAMAAMDIAEVSRDLAVLADVEAALVRIKDGSYGECIDCGVEIPYARLAAYPAAKRCVACQEIAEAAVKRGLQPR
jgi:DnaK suppressor protein